MSHKGVDTQDAGKKRLSYRQVIFFCLGGLMVLTFLIFFTYIYCNLREECRERALQRARDTAENVAVWTDECFALTDITDAEETSVWEQGIKARVDSREGVVILDEQGQTLFSSNQMLNGLCQETLYTNIESQILTGGGVNWAVGIKTPETLEWNCFVFHDVAEEMEKYHFSFSRFALLLLLVMFSFSAATYLIYRIIDRLLNSAGGEKETKLHGKNELELQKIFTLRLIRGDILIQDEYKEYVKNFGLQSLRRFVTIVSVLDFRNEDSQSNVNEDDICHKIAEEMPEQLKKLAWMPPVYNACAIVTILEEDDDELLLKKLEKYYTESQNFSKGICGYQLLTGVSAIHTDFRHICAAYRESIHALTRSERVGRMEEIYSDLDVRLPECHFYINDFTTSETSYDTSYEKKVQSGIKNMDKAQCYQAADEFFRYLTGQNYHQDEIMVYVLQFVNSILLTAMEIRMDLETLYPDGFRRLYEELMEILEPSRERRYIKKNLIDPILETRNKLMEKRSYSLLEDIEQLIHEKKGDISLAECAEILGVHTTYIWKVLKTERGKTFSDFLEEYKLEEAKRLLLNTDMTVAEIATVLNYTNAQNFIRFFSKSTGMTPGKFRKLY